MSSPADPLAVLRPYVDNPLPILSTPYLAGVLGDHPSTYSRSPAMWNAAFAVLGLPVTYLPFDVAPQHLPQFLSACAAVPGLLGLNVTVPYKAQVASHLDGMDRAAATVEAINTIVRTGEGKFIGANTDGAGVLTVLREEWGFGAPAARPKRLLLLGAGGAARAVAFAAGSLPGADVVVVARRPERAGAVADAVRHSGGRASSAAESALDGLLSEADVIVNATPVGMVGPLRFGSGVTWLEPFSALAPAKPPISTDVERSSSQHRTPPAEWWERAWPAIGVNLHLSLRRALRVRAETRMLDLVYMPEESVTLKHLRWTGHDARNGAGVLLQQAVDAFLLVTRSLLTEDGERYRPAVAAAMASAKS